LQIKWPAPLSSADELSEHSSLLAANAQELGGALTGAKVVPTFLLKTGLEMKPSLLTFRNPRQRPRKQSFLGRLSAKGLRQ
jgi:hypothetical protein